MLEPDWILESFGQGKLEASLELSRELLCKDAISSISSGIRDGRDEHISSEIKRSIDVLELNLIDKIYNRHLDGAEEGHLSKNASDLFELYRGLEPPQDPFARLKFMIKAACFGVVGDKNADINRYLKETPFPNLDNHNNWAERVFMSSGLSFLFNVRKNGWEDLEKASDIIMVLRQHQKIYEDAYLKEGVEEPQSAALELVAMYHLAKAMDMLSTFIRCGERPVRVLHELNFHFDRMREASGQIDLAELAILSVWIQQAVQRMVKSSVWWIVHSTNPNLTNFVKQLSSRNNSKPIFELWPSQSKALVQEGLLDPAKRAVVIQMPTSGGKTLLAEFRILQTKQSYPNAWIAYIVPTRALVNQISNRLREDLSPIGIRIERAVPAFELDPMEEELLMGEDSFDVLVTTQEKLDLLIRSGRLISEKKPLGLVILDEAHNIKGGERGLRTELLLATINREFDNVQFLLLSPFVPNMEELAHWLGAERSAKISIDWRPNNQLVCLAYPTGKGADWSLTLRPLATSQPTLNVKNELALTRKKTIRKTRSALSKRDISSAVGSILSERSGVIVIALKKNHINAIAKDIHGLLPELDNPSEEVLWVKKYIATECGEDFLLHNLIQKGVAFHHAGVPNEVRYLLEWLMSRGHLKVMVATTTLAQGMNFPISAVVINDFKVDVPPKPISADEFWNIAGRAGRSDQETLGIIAFSSKKSNDVEIEEFLQKQVSELTSYLENIVYDAIDSGSQLDLNHLVRNRKEWSSFVQYLCHAYRQVGDHSRFISETETLMKATYGYQRIARKNSKVARDMVRATVDYAKHIEKIDPQVLNLVDQTGFSPDTLIEMRKGVKSLDFKVTDLSASGLFSTSHTYLKAIIGTLMAAPELDFKVPVGRTEGADVAEVISMWVRGEPISSISQHKIFNINDSDRTNAVTECTQTLTNYINNAAWGLGAFESLSLRKEELEKMDNRKRLEIMSIPAMVYFGVNTLEGVALRNLGVPRSIAVQMGENYRKETNEAYPSLSKMKTWLENLEVNRWDACTSKGSRLSGREYQIIWKIMNGNYSPSVSTAIPPDERRQ